MRILLLLFLFASLAMNAWLYIDSLPPVVEQLKATTSEQAAPTEGDKPILSDEERKRDTDEAIARYTLLLMIFTGVLAVSTVGLWIVTWRGASNQSRDMKASIAVAEDNARAALISAKVARDTLVASHRAWVEPFINKGSGSLILHEHIAQYSVDLIFKNTGNVPATNIQFEGWLVPRKMSSSNGLDAISPVIPHREKCNLSRAKSRDHGNMLFPNEVFPSAQGHSSVEMGCIMSKEELRAASFDNEGKRCIVLYAGGAINYTFGTDTAVHQTSFLYELTYKGISCAFCIGEFYAAEDIGIHGIPEGDGRQSD